MVKNNLKLIKFIFVISLLFFIAIGLDISPYLRGPGVYPPDWRWEYYFVNTLSKIWFPFIIIVLMSGMLYFLEKKKESSIQQKEKIILSLLVILGFLFQLSILYFSRAGIPVLIHRIINPDLNGYFTTAIKIKDIGDFLKTYNDSVLNFAMHAKGHMPFSVLFFYIVNNISSLFTPLYNLVERFSPSHADVLFVWRSLLPNQKIGALIASILIPFLSSSSIIPLYLLGKRLYGIKSALRSTFLYLVTPSVVLFAPINDVFLPLFPVISLLFFYKSISNKSIFFMVISGIIISFGILFSLSLLPFLFMFLVIFLLKKKANLINPENIKLGISFVIGTILTPLLLLAIYNFNFLEVTKTLMSGLPENRQYATWILYNLYDFFIFAGIPILIIFVVMLWQRFFKVDHLFLAFVLMLFLLNFSGSVRGEIARIWIPFMPILIFIVANFVTNKLKFSTKFFLAIFILQVIQVLVFQEFLVTLW